MSYQIKLYIFAIIKRNSFIELVCICVVLQEEILEFSIVISFHKNDNIIFSANLLCIFVT